MRTSNTRTTHRRRLPKPDRCARTGKVRWPDSRAAVEVLHLAKNSASKAQADGIATHRLEASIVIALAAGNTIAATCELTSASRPQVMRIVNDPVMQARIREERARIGTESTAALVAHSRQAANYLVSIVNDVTAPDASRVRAAGLLLSEARAWRTDDIEDRLTELEALSRRVTLRTVSPSQ